MACVSICCSGPQFTDKFMYNTLLYYRFWIFVSLNIQFWFIFHCVLCKYSIYQSRIKKNVMISCPIVGKTPRDKVDCDMMVEHAMDFRNGVIRLCYDNDYVRFMLCCLNQEVLYTVSHVWVPNICFISRLFYFESLV